MADESFTVRFPDEVVARLDRIAKQKRVGRAAVIRWAADEYLAAHPEEDSAPTLETAAS